MKLSGKVQLINFAGQQRLILDCPFEQVSPTNWDHRKDLIGRMVRIEATRIDDGWRVNVERFRFADSLGRGVGEWVEP
jgi:hypothetical protein